MPRFRAPALAALPKYLGSHNFVGRADELRTLNDWCGEADSKSDAAVRGHGWLRQEHADLAVVEP
jgi:hypothetical protein